MNNNKTTSVSDFTVSIFTKAPLRLSKSTQLQASRETVFGIISDHEALAQLFPWVKAVTVDNAKAEVEGGVGTKRCCNFGNGLQLEEVIVGWEPPQLLAYTCLEATNPFGLRDHLGLVTCAADNQSRTILTWQHYFEHLNPKAMQEKMAGALELAYQILINRFAGKLLETYINFK